MNEEKKEKRGGICFYNVDCIEFMKSKPDKFYDLAIVDPPYGIGAVEWMGKDSGNKRKNSATKKGTYKIKDWDNKTPNEVYFNELFRISHNQIIWGGNYMTQYLKPSAGWIFWDKDNGNNGFSDGELAFTSFDKGLRKVKITWNGMLQYNMKNKETRIHPTQKPIMLYRWILNEYAKQGMKILDTHGGSHTHAIACDMEGFELDICEIDVDYHKDGLKAFDNYKLQTKLF